MQADALQPETLASALQGMEVAFYLVHSMAAAADFRQLDLVAAEHFASAAAAAGVKRIVHLGGLVPRQDAGEHIDSRRETGAILRKGGHDARGGHRRG